MLLVDYRTGSKDLVSPLQDIGLAVETSTLEFGDIAFEGKGAAGTTVNIGIERKRLSDLVTSLREGRLSGHQLPGMLGPKGLYEYCWIVVEGEYKVNAVGQIVVPTWRNRKKTWAALPAGMFAAEMERRLLTLELCGGVHVRFTRDRDDTCRFITDLYRWWTDHALDEHTSHLAPHTGPHGFLPLSKFRTAVMAWDDVGLRVSLAAEVRFGGSIRRAANAGVEDWAAITTLDKHGKARRLGTKTAERIVAFCRGEKS